MYYYCARCQSPLVPNSRICDRCGEVFDNAVPPPPQSIDPSMPRAVIYWPPNTSAKGLAGDYHTVVRAIESLSIGTKFAIVSVAILLVIIIAVVNFRSHMVTWAPSASHVAIAAGPSSGQKTPIPVAPTVQRVASKQPPIIAPPPSWNPQQLDSGDHGLKGWSPQPAPTDSSVPSLGQSVQADPETPTQQQAMQAYIAAWQDASITNSNLNLNFNILPSGAAPGGLLYVGLMRLNNDLATMRQMYPNLSSSDQEQVESNRMEAQVQGDVAIWSAKLKEEQEAEFGGQ